MLNNLVPRTKEASRSYAVLTGLFWIISAGMLLAAPFQETELSTDAYDPRKLFQMLQQGDYAAGLDYLEKRPSDNPMYWQELATTQSMVGDYFGALQSMDKVQGTDRPPEDGELKDLPQAVPRNALEEIVRLAADRQIVILNEAHHVALHRAFAVQLAAKLKPLGFEFLAAETFNLMSMKSLAENGIPLPDTGFYTLEPVFADFVRQAIRDGYRPIAYEMIKFPPRDADPTDRINFRETQQVENLMAQIFRDRPDAKAFIFVGYHHATEDTRTAADGRETAWMAARLQKALGIDPLTIDQTEQTERGSRERSSAAWQQVYAASATADQPVVMALENDRYWIGPGYRQRVDVQVFHPPTKLNANRPHWLAQIPGRQPVDLPADLAAPADRYLVQARLASEPDKAIPVDQFLWMAGADRPQLWLAPGDYRLVVFDRIGTQVFEAELTVKRP